MKRFVVALSATLVAAGLAVGGSSAASAEVPAKDSGTVVAGHGWDVAKPAPVAGGSGTIMTIQGHGWD